MSFISGQVSQRLPEPFYGQISEAFLAAHFHRNQANRVPLFAER